MLESQTRARLDKKYAIRITGHSPTCRDYASGPRRNDQTLLCAIPTASTVGLGVRHLNVAEASKHVEAGITHSRALGWFEVYIGN
jgi:hypothetical protein